MSTTRTLNNISRFDLCFTTREVGEENLFFVAVFAREAKIPLSGGKGMHAFGPRSRISLMGERNGALQNVPALIRREGFGRQEKRANQGNMTYFFPTETIRWIIFGSSGNRPDFGSRGVSSIQFRSIANTLRKSGNDSSTRPMLTNATACQ